MMFEQGQKVFGFTVDRTRFNQELEGTLVEMTHDKTGAQLCWMDNGLENKVFSIAFKTIPTDSTGVFHILEHSVLCGSEKYRVREPFVELIKSSMNTFLNAMTFQDMTMYPVASRNDRDLMNLTGVYLDAVFAPNILSNPNIFCQEGWHIEKDDEGNYTYKGVVFNEMKGAMGEVDQLMERKLLQMLFPDCGYGFNSGGDPEVIPDLTYEAFIAAYKKHYHPSNARIWLDGAVPMDEMLPLIDSYLSRYERSGEKISLDFQTPKACEETILFEIGQDEDRTNKGRLDIGKIIGTWQDKTRNNAVAILGDVLTGSNESPLKQAILGRGLAQDISLGIDDSIAQSYMTICVDNVTDGREQELLDAIQEFAADLKKNGLDRDALEASLNRFSFRMRENEEPQGLGRTIRAMGSWLHDGDPMYFLTCDSVIAELREMLDNGGFDRLAEEILLNTDYRAILHAVPSLTVGDEKRLQEKKRLDKITGQWTTGEIKANEEMKSALDLWQQTPDSPETLATLPVLKVEDADQEPEWTATEIRDVNNVTVMYHRLPCHGVVHLNLYFNLSDLTREELTMVTFLGGLLGRMPTAGHDILRLEQDIKKYTGHLEFFIRIRTNAECDNECTPVLCVTASVLEENLPKAIELMTEILTTTRFDVKDKLNEFVMQCEMSGRQKGVAAGHRIAMTDTLSHFSSEYAAKEALEGASAIRWVHAFATDFDGQYESFVRLATRIRDTSFCKARMTIGLTAQKEYDLTALTASLPEGTAIPDSACYHVESPMGRGYRIPAQIGFASRGYRLSELGKAFHGSMWLASNILSLGYLWNQVRVQGGAYGTGIQVDRNGHVFTYSFRDPTPGRTLDVDRGLSSFLKSFAGSGEPLDKFIISALNDINPLLSAKDKGALADARWQNHYTREMAEKLRTEILHSTIEDILACSEWLDAFYEKGARCVVAHKDALNDIEGLEIMDL